MAFLSERSLDQLVESQSLAFSASGTLKEASLDPQNKDAFLSHSSKDKRYLPGVILFLRSHGATTYIDDGDQQLPSQTSAKTAVVLRTRIAECPRFIVLVTSNSKDSKWIPWELGLADGLKQYAKVAILPVTQTGSEDAWATQEYLGIYCRIYQQNDGAWRVLDLRDNMAWALKDWLKGSVE